jgi:FkbM family methyltransferase
MVTLMTNFCNYLTNNITCANDGDICQLFICKELINKIQIPNSVFVDIGAFAGGWASMISHFTNSQGIIYAYEPSQQHFKMLEENCKNMKNVHLHNYGIGTEEAEVNLILTGNGAHVQSNLDILGDCRNVETIKIKPFNIQQPIHTMKIDIDGYESKLLPKLYHFLPQIHSLICEFTVYFFSSSKEECAVIAQPILEKIMSHYPFTYGISRNGAPFCVRIQKENISEWVDEHFDRHLSTDILFTQHEISTITVVPYCRNAWYA